MMIKTPKNLRVYRASLKDLSDLARLFDGYRVFYRQKSNIRAAKSFLQKHFKQHTSIIFAARDIRSKTTLGFVQLYPLYSSVRMRPVWVLNDLYVVRAARGLGVGTALLKEAAVFAKKKKAGYLMLQTEKKNHAAQSLYEKLGWKKDQDCFYYYLG